MDCLFIHGNYPGQFRHLAGVMADGGHRVIFLTARHNAPTDTASKLEVRCFQTHRPPSPETHPYLTSSEQAVLQGQGVARALVQLLGEGFKPRVVISHGGMGLGLFIKDLLPDTIHVGYFEWFCNPETSQFLLKPFDLNAQMQSGLRNLVVLQELECCDQAVVPTAWQRSQFPKTYQDKLTVIFDGIDTSFFHPCTNPAAIHQNPVRLENRETKECFTLSPGRRILSYATRGMEPVRGFPEFMRALPNLLSADDRLEVVIGGADRCAYSYRAPSHKGSWKNHLLEELGDFPGRDRVHFTGLLSYSDYRLLLWRSNLHCYFTRPYITSWSLFEAAACNTPLAVSKNPATHGILEETSTAWVDLDNPEELVRTLQQSLQQTPARPSKLQAGYALTQALNQWQTLLNQALRAKPLRQGSRATASTTEPSASRDD